MDHDGYCLNAGGICSPEALGAPWCGAPAELGGQGPCPMADPCSPASHECRIADDAERDEPDQ